MTVLVTWWTCINPWNDVALLWTMNLDDFLDVGNSGRLPWVTLSETVLPQPFLIQDRHHTWNQLENHHGNIVTDGKVHTYATSHQPIFPNIVTCHSFQVHERNKTKKKHHDLARFDQQRSGLNMPWWGYSCITCLQCLWWNSILLSMKSYLGGFP